MKVNENVRIEREKNIEARQEDIRRIKMEREMRERVERIKIEREKRERAEKIKKEIEKKERMERARKEFEEKERIEREKEKIKSRREMISASIIFIIFAIIAAFNFEEFIVYLKTIGTIVGFVIIGLFVNFFKPLLHCTKPHYTKPHRYIVQDEINKNYEIKRGLNTTTYIPKNKR